MTFRPNAEATRAFTRSLARSTDSLVTPGSLAQIKLGRWCDPGRRSSAVAAFSIEAKTPILAILPSVASTHGQNSTSIQNEKIVQGGWKPQEERRRIARAHPTWPPVPPISARFRAESRRKSSRLSFRPKPPSGPRSRGPRSRGRRYHDVGSHEGSQTRKSRRGQASLTDHPERRHLEGVQILPDRAGDEPRRNRGAVVVQDRHDPDRIDAALVHDQRAQLSVAVLLDQEHELVLGNEIWHVLMEREGADAQHVEAVAALLQHHDRLVHGGRRRTIIDHAAFGRLVGVAADGARDEVLGGLELAQQALHIVGVDVAVLCIAGVAVARGATGEV